MPIDTPESAQAGQKVTYLFEFRLASGNLLKSSEINSLIANASISIRNSQSLTYTTYVNGNYLYVNFTSSDSGYYNNYTAVSKSFLQNASVFVRITNSTGVVVNMPDW